MVTQEARPLAIVTAIRTLRTQGTGASKSEIHVSSVYISVQFSFCCSESPTLGHRAGSRSCSRPTAAAMPGVAGYYRQPEFQIDGTVIFVSESDLFVVNISDPS